MKKDKSLVAVHTHTHTYTLKQLKKSEKGITLIALIITVIILLILTGIAITQLSNSGLFGKTQKSKEKYETAQLEEEATMAISEGQILATKEGNGNLADYIIEKNILQLDTGKIEYIGDDTFIFTDNDNKKIKLIKNLNGDIVLANVTKSFSVSFMEDKESKNVLKVINVLPDTLVNTDEEIDLNIDGYVLIGWERKDDPNKTITKFNMPNNDVVLYPVLYTAEDYKIWLSLGGIENPSNYNESSIYSNASLMSTLMDNEDAVNYMIKSKNQIMKKVLNNTTSASALGESIIAKEKVHNDSTWVAYINDSSYKYKYLTSSVIPKMNSSNLNPDGKSMTKNGVTVRISDYQNTNTNVVRTIDKDLSSHWLTESGLYGTHYFTVEFSNPVCIKSYYYNRKWLVGNCSSI